ncbi:DUF2333 family protein [Halomonas sp. H5]|uniref:DUF2333 family protein n=1 Tax=Halomonas sp. H5 TaxID=3423910 RepID=UPI003D35BA74
MPLFGKRKAVAGRSTALERPEYGWIWKPLVVLLVLYLLVTLAIGIWWSREPAAFEVEQATANARVRVAAEQPEAATSPASRGAVTTAALIGVAEVLVQKPGGYLRNDIFPPGLWLDNMPNWEYGVLRQSRELAQWLPSLEQEDAAALEEALEQLMGESRDWLFPSTETRLEAAAEALGEHLLALGRGEAGFADDGDGLALWLERVAVRLDDLSQRLSASVGEREALRDLAIDSDELPDPTPWYRLDDDFFEARGQAWALLHFLRAVERDYADVLAAAEAQGLLTRLIGELEMTQRRLWSPLVLNGSGFGIFANHSLVMANYTVRARDLATRLADRLEGVSVPAWDAGEAAVEAPAPAEEALEEAPQEEPVQEEEATQEEEAAPQEEMPLPEEAPAEPVPEDSGEPEAEEAAEA